MDYRAFLASKRETVKQYGFEVDPAELNPRLKNWQRDLVAWSLRRGRSALFEDCGLGKTFQQLEWAAAIWRREQRPVLLLCPVAVAEQTIREAAKFDVQAPIQAVTCQAEVARGINVTNYEKLHKFDVRDFIGVVLDESSILKSFAGATKRQLCEQFEHTPYRLACTATEMSSAMRTGMLQQIYRAEPLQKYSPRTQIKVPQWISA